MEWSGVCRPTLLAFHIQYVWCIALHALHGIGVTILKGGALGRNDTDYTD